MRTKWATIVVAGVMLGLLLAGPAAAHRVSIAGSVRVTGAAGAPLDPDALVGVAVIANPGFEKTITQHLPPFTLPVFIEEDWSDDGDDAANRGLHNRGLRLLRRHLDTTLVLTNTTGSDLPLHLTLWDAAGVEIGSLAVTLMGHQTKLLPVSSLLD